MNRKNRLCAAVAATFITLTSFPAVAAEGPNDAALHDAWLDGKLETALLFNEHLNSFAIDTDVENGVALLTGTVESEIDRDLAGEIARSIEGVQEVRNELTVDAGQARTARDEQDADDVDGFQESVLDATVTARVKTQLLVNEHTEGLDIDVDTDNGTVSLSGSVASDEEKELAGQIAANTEGAVSVENRLTVAETEEAE